MLIARCSQVTDSDLPFSSNSHIGVVGAGGATAVVATEALLQRYHVDGIIRLHADDFALLGGTLGVFVHFNLGSTLNKAGERYVLLPIVKQGHRLPDGREVLPVVDPDQFRIGVCLSVQQRVPIGDVTAGDFAHSLPTLRTAAQLRAVLLTRYAPMFPDRTAEAILSHGCAVTRLRLLP